MRAVVRYIGDVIVVVAMLVIGAGLASVYVATIAVLYLALWMACYISSCRLAHFWSKGPHVRNPPTNRGQRTPPRRHP